MIFDLKYDRASIRASLEIADPTFRYHMANIKRKQAVMRREKAERETVRQQARQVEKYLPETGATEAPVVETAPTISQDIKSVLHPLPPSVPSPAGSFAQSFFRKA